MLNVANPTASGSAIDSVTNFISGAPDLIDRFKTVFAKNEPIAADADEGEGDQ